MFTSFAQLASTLEASLSLDSLQGAATGLQEVATGVKKNQEGASIEPNNASAKRSIKPQLESVGSNKHDETEMLLVEEISRVSEILRSKDAECSALQAQLSEYQDDIQSRKLALSDLQDELTARKLSEKSLAQEHDDKMSSAEREIADLREEVDRQKKICNEKSAKILMLESELAAAPIRIETSEEFTTNSSNDQNIAHLQHENSSLKREVAQNLSAYNESAVQIRTLEGLIDEAKTLRRQNEDKLVVSQREINSLKEIVENSLSESTRLGVEKSNLAEEYDKLVEEHSKLEKESSKLGEDHSKLRDEYSKHQLDAFSLSEATFAEAILLKESLSVLNNEINKQKATNNALKEMCDKQTAADNEKTNEINDLCTSLSEVSDLVENEKKKTSVTELQLSDMNKNLNEKNETITELQGKLSLLTEKMKDIVRKYSEMKTKNSNLEQTGGEKAAEILRNLQTKVDSCHKDSSLRFFLE